MDLIKKWEKRIIQQNEAHLWIYQDQGGVFPGRSMEVLDQNEQSTYKGYLSAEKQREFLIGRIFTKHILAQYLNIYPARIKYSFTENGKPYLNGFPFHINLSHSHGVYAFLIGKSPVGVDVESTQRKRLEEHFSHVFTPNEIEKLASLEGEAQNQYFFQLWTMKEAFWKAIDKQENLPFNGFEVNLNPISVHSHSADIPQRDWHLSFQEVLNHYLIATAIEKKPEELIALRTFHLEEALQNSLFTYP